MQALKRYNRIGLDPSHVWRTKGELLVFGVCNMHSNVFVRACEAHQHILTGGWNGTIWSWWAWHVFKPWFNHHNISQQALKHYTCGTTTFRHATTQGVAHDPKQSRDYAEIPSVSSQKRTNPWGKWWESGCQCFGLGISFHSLLRDR